MACAPELTVEVDRDELRLTAKCTGQCAGGGACRPIIEPDVTHDRRFSVRHRGTGARKYTLHVEVEDEVENFTFHAKCQCGDGTEGDDAYTIASHDPDETEEVILDVLSFGIRVLIRALSGAR